MVLLQSLNELSSYVSKASQLMLVGMKYIIVIYLVYYIAIRGKESDEVIQELTDCLETTTSMLVYKPYELLDICERTTSESVSISLLRSIGPE